MASTDRLRANITVIQKAKHSSVITLMFLIELHNGQRIMYRGGKLY